ncbi:MAG: four-carbon acid sugar kinase family protein [Desulforhopalus sp.]
MMGSNEKLAIIADDYTGAGDSGVHFSKMGRQVDLLFQKERLDEQLRQSNTVSLTTESRFMDPGEAASAVAEAVQKCQAAGFARFFKKIDSTLRGNPGHEIEAALDVTGKAAALICTAMPKTGRTCRGGIVYVDGIPLHMTDIAADPFHPISTSSVAESLGRQLSLPSGSLTLDDIGVDSATLTRRLTSLINKGIRLIIADGVTDEHLLALAAQIDKVDVLPVGAGGFAGALAYVWRTMEPEIGAEKDFQAEGPVLAVIGSLAGISRQQAELACRCGYFKPFDIRTDFTLDDIDREFTRFLADQLQGSPNILLRIAHAANPAGVAKEEGMRVARLLGGAAAGICHRYRCRTLFSTGGSTSIGVARALGIRAVSLLDELMPGVVLGSCSAAGTTVEWFISKAGGFGDREILKKIAAGLADSNKWSPQE